MDREALVLRNRTLAQAFHATPFKHRARRLLLQSVKSLPVRRSQPSRTERILLIRPDHLGDVLLTTPAIHALRTAHPQAEIHALVGPWSAAVLAPYDELDAIITLPFPGFSRTPKRGLRSPYELAWRSARQLRQVGYTSAVILRPDHWWGALLAYLAGIPQRVGFNLPDVVPFLTQAISDEPIHNVRRNLRLVEGWTGQIASEGIVYRFPVGEADRAFVDSYLSEWGIAPDQRLLCIHPGSGTWAKRWDESSWARVADTLTEQLGLPVVFSGGDHELPMVRSIVEQMKTPACVMAGDTQVGQLAALFARGQVVLGPDSGPMHLAAAVGAATVTLFGPADPAEFAPWGTRDRHIVLTSDIGCRPCNVIDWGGDDPAYHPCVREIPISRVLEAARRAAQASVSPG
ncbi:MAG: glycosyltransferase family 9 protein [bacterium]|nr:glycosyltransferase family 9 protein [bacterium]